MHTQSLVSAYVIDRDCYSRKSYHFAGDSAPICYPLLPGLNEPRWQIQSVSTEKRGTLRFDQSGYKLPPNDLPGITPLHLNENLFATAKAGFDKAQMADLMQTHLNQLHSYPINGVKQLQEAIASDLGIEADKIVISNGSSTLLRNTILYLLQENDILLIPAPSWSFYHSLADLVGARIETFPLIDTGDAFLYDKHLIAAEIERCHPKSVLLCSPNNPTGTVLSIEDLLWLVDIYPDVAFILDEAYYGFCESYSAIQAQQLLDSTDRGNLFVIRTFSKFYGLANLRIGFLICSATDAQKLQMIGPVFGLPSFSQALAASRLADKQYECQLRQEYAAVNAAMYTAFQQIPGFTPYKTGANFMFVKHDGRWASLPATLLDYGYKIKTETINGDCNYFRITYADLATTDQLLATIRQLCNEAPSYFLASSRTK